MFAEQVLNSESDVVEPDYVKKAAKLYFQRMCSGFEFRIVNQ